MKTTIIFDLGEVYLKGLIGVENYLESILKMKPKEIFPKLKGDVLVKFMHGEITEDKYWDETIKINNWKVDIKHFKKAIRDNFGEIEGTREIIETLKKKGFKLGLLSVHSKEWTDYCDKKFDYHKLFDSILYSFEVAISKPDERVYKLVLKKLGVKPEECLFIDDRIKNIEGAEKIGIKSILFKDSKKLREDLENLNIL